MAAVADMGEVDEMHSKEEGSIVTNGDLMNDVDMEDQDSRGCQKKVSSPAPMEVTESKYNNETKDVADTPTITEESSGDSSISDENQSSDHEDESSQEPKVNNDQTERDDISENDQKLEEPDSNNEPGKSIANSETEEIPVPQEEASEKENVEQKSSDEGDKTDIKSETNETKAHSIVEIHDEIHEIESDDEEDSKGNKISNEEPIELNDSGGEGDGDVMIVDSPKENGTEVIDLDETPEKKESSTTEEEDDDDDENSDNVPPRRSVRNLHKQKSYAESDKESEKEEEILTSPRSEESDIEEVLPQDPLACSDAISVERVPAEKPKPPGKPSTIVVKDTKRLVEIASKSNNSTQGKKEPTLVIIDTNSILSGKGPVPVPVNKPAPVSTPTYPTVLPMALPAQGMYPPNMRATITPIPVNTSNVSSTPTHKAAPATITPTLNLPPLLPSLTDDMFVVEAPSFIVPYVYEKPPSKDIKGFMKEIEKEIEKEKEDKKNEENDCDKNEEEDDKDKVKQEEKDEPKKEYDDPKKPYSFFNSPLGKFFINLGFNLVQEQVQSDLLKQQKRKASREGHSNPETEKTIKTLSRNLQFSRANNEPHKLVIKKCEFCHFKTESALAMAYHLETPHMKNFVYKCNFCSYEVRSPHDILFHMEAEHAVRGHLERAPSFHQCPNCPFEDNTKGKLSRHLVACMRKFKPERNLEPPVDWEPPAKIPRVPKMRQQGLNATVTAYQSLTKNAQYQFLSKMQLQSTQQALQRGRGRPTLGQHVKPPAMLRPSGVVFKQQPMTSGSVLVPTSYQLSGNQVFQNTNQKKAPAQQPSISITPLPRGTNTSVNPVAPAKPGDTTSKNSFVICEICDGYIKDLEQLRNHMQWIHKIKIHPKMIYNRPPLNCQKCQFRFFTDQGLERHLLGSHGLVTSSMQDAANKSKDSGRCPVCGRVYQWKLLNHVARDHNMTLKPAHLSYKCTVCTATFGMYKQFENHVYSAHSVVAKRVMDKKGASGSPAPKSDQMKSLKINDEITIIPQPAKSNGAAKEGSPSSTGSSNSKSSTPSTSKNPDSTTPSSSRAEPLARRNANGNV